MTLNGDDLVRALHSPARFAKLRAELLKDGHTDGEIIRAMANARALRDALGPAPSTPRIKHGRK